jgi:hypothetical protein
LPDHIHILCEVKVLVNVVPQDKEQERGQKKAAMKRGFEFKQGGVKQSGQKPLEEVQIALN